jgi:cytoskeletal protein RodZ
MSNFGANFRKARESAGLTLEKIAADTRISTRFLTAIENEAFQLLPGGIFNRGFIRAYAEYLGLDSEQAVADYDRMASAAQETIDVTRDADQPIRRSPEWNLYIVAAAILLVLMAAYYFVTRKSASTGQVPPAAVAAAPETTDGHDAPVPLAGDTVPQPEEPTVTAAPPVVSTPPPAQATTPVNSAPSPSPSPSPPPRLPSTASVPTALAVDLAVIDATWVKVTTDGTVAVSDILQAGETRRFSAGESIDVTIGNAAGVTMQVNGRELGSLGTSGRVREFKITPENAARIR